MATTYELDYQKIHNTLRKDNSTNYYGYQIGQKIDNLITPTLQWDATNYLFPNTIKTKVTYGNWVKDTSVAEGYRVAIQYADTPNDDAIVINKNFYMAHEELQVNTDETAITRIATNEYPSFWFKSDGTQLGDCFIPYTLDLTTNQPYIDIPLLYNDQGNYGFVCTSKIKIDPTKPYMFQMSCPSGIGNLWQTTRVYFQISTENVSQNNNQFRRYNQICTSPLSATEETSNLIQWNGSPIKLDLSDTFTDGSIYTSDLCYLKANNSVPDPLGADNNWMPFASRDTYVNIFIFIPNTSEYKALLDDSTFFFFQADRPYSLDDSGTIIAYDSSQYLTAHFASNLTPAYGWTITNSGLFTQEYFQPQLNLEDNNLVLSLNTAESKAALNVSFKDLISYLKRTDQELLAIPYHYYGEYRRRCHSDYNQKNKHLTHKCGYVSYVCRTFNRSVFNTCAVVEQGGTGTKTKYAVYACNPDLHYGGIRFTNWDDESATLDNFKVSFSNSSNLDAALPVLTADESITIADTTYTGCPRLDFSNSYIHCQVQDLQAQGLEKYYPKIQKVNWNGNTNTVFARKYYLDTWYKNASPSSGSVTPTPYIKPDIYNPVTPVNSASIDATSGAITLNAATNWSDINKIPETALTYTVVSARLDKHCYLRPLTAGDALPGYFQNLSYLSATKLRENEAKDIYTALTNAGINIDMDNAQWVKIAFRWGIWDRSNFATYIDDPVVGDRYNQWGYKGLQSYSVRESRLQSPYIYISRNCGDVDVSNLTDSTQTNIVNAFGWPEVKFIEATVWDKTAFIAIPAAWLK